MTAAAIIQARMTSTRFPGKVLAELDVRGAEAEKQDAARLDAPLRVRAPEADLPVVDQVLFLFRRLREGGHLGSCAAGASLAARSARVEF